MKIKYPGLLLLVLSNLLLITMSCRGPTSPSPLRSPELYGPVCTGLILTDEMGNILRVWGKPSIPKTPEECPFSFFPNYPNPFNPLTRIMFGVFRKTKITIWIVAASYYSSSYGREILPTNGIEQLPKGLSVRTLLNDIEMVPGHYQIIWDGRNDDEKILPNGFYRIYMQGDGFLLWRDMMLLYLDNYIPPELIGICRELFPNTNWAKYLIQPGG